MMTLLGATILVLLFILLIYIFDLIGKSKKVLSFAQQAFAVLGDPGLDDHQKEKLMRGFAGKLFIQFFIIVGVCIVALGAPLAVVKLMDLAGWLSFEKVMALSLGWQFIVGASVVMIVAAWLMTKGKPQTKSSESYSGLEKSLHHLAFSTIPAQISISSLTTKMYSKKLHDIEIVNPVFITALPRAGTTLLLELCFKTGEFVSHTYRDMPFILTPILWNKFSKLFKQSDQMRERAHGDGMMVSADSPEAFEEIIWNAFWPSRYRRKKIVPWPVTEYPDFEKFFQDHLRKLVAIEQDQAETSLRYISKNNLNISRIPYLQKMMPDAIILVPFRSPLQHAASLLKQHCHFSEIHKNDNFAEYYMRAIGHYDFGANLRPVDFDKWLNKAHDPNTLNFWLQYWKYAYRYLLNNTTPRTRFISFEAMCHDPENNMRRLADFLELENKALLVDQAGRISLPKAHPVNLTDVDESLLQQTEELHKELHAVSIS